MRVLHLIRSVEPAAGGTVEGLRQTCEASQRLGHETEVVTLDAPDAPWISEFPAPVRCFGPAALKFGYARHLVPWLATNHHRFDAAVVHGLWQFHGLATWRACRQTALPYYVYPHGMLDPWFKKAHPLKHLKKVLYWHLAESRLIRDARAVLFTTVSEARLAERSFGNYSANARIVGYGMNFPDPDLNGQSEIFLNRFPNCRNKRVILSLSRIHPKKGIDLLIQAFGACAHRDPSLHLVIAGPDEAGTRPKLAELAKTLGISGRITWTDILSGNLKWGAFRIAEVFALMSHQENFGLAVTEALALGVPVLITDQVNIWETISNEGAGLVGPDTTEGATQTLGRWLDCSAAERAQMASNALRCFSTHFHIDASTQNLVAALREGSR